MVQLTEKERITLLMIRGWGDHQQGYKTVHRLFNAEFRDQNNQIAKSTVVKTIRRFEETGSVKDRPRTGRPKSSTNEEKSLEVLQSFVEDPSFSLRRVSAAHDISIGSSSKILKINKWHPYKIVLHQELAEDDFDRRTEFCEIMMDMINDDPLLLNNIVFSDEATFELHGNVNRQNMRYWSDINPHWMRENNTQYPQKLNVWAGIYNGQKVGPFFIDGNLNGEKYRAMLEDQIVPAIQNLTNGQMDDVHFQQDGAPPHYTRSVRQYLDQVFPGRWIGRRGVIEWPARSPDLTPLDYFLWGYLKGKVYTTKPQNLDELRARIIHEMDIIPQEMYQRATEAFYTRLAHCQTVEGQHFEHLL